MTGKDLLKAASSVDEDILQVGEGSITLGRRRRSRVWISTAAAAILLAGILVPLGLSSLNTVQHEGETVPETIAAETVFNDQSAETSWVIYRDGDGVTAANGLTGEILGHVANVSPLTGPVPIASMDDSKKAVLSEESIGYALHGLYSFAENKWLIDPFYGDIYFYGDYIGYKKNGKMSLLDQEGKELFSWEGGYFAVGKKYICRENQVIDLETGRVIELKDHVQAVWKDGLCLCYRPADDRDAPGAGQRVYSIVDLKNQKTIMDRQTDANPGYNGNHGRMGDLLTWKVRWDKKADAILTDLSGEVVLSYDEFWDINLKKNGGLLDKRLEDSGISAYTRSSDGRHWLFTWQNMPEDEMQYWVLDENYRVTDVLSGKDLAVAVNLFDENAVAVPYTYEREENALIFTDLFTGETHRLEFAGAAPEWENDSVTLVKKEGRRLILTDDTVTDTSGLFPDLIGTWQLSEQTGLYEPLNEDAPQQVVLNNGLICEAAQNEETGEWSFTVLIEEENGVRRVELPAWEPDNSGL